MDKERFLSSGLLEQYILGLTSPEESEEVEKYLKAFPELQSEADAMRKAIEQYALQHSVPPPAHLKTRILTEIDQLTEEEQAIREQAIHRAHAAKNRAIGIGALAGILLILLAGYLYQQLNRAEHDLQRLNARFAAFQEACQEKQETLKQQAQLYAFLNHQNTRPVLLQGTGLAPNAEVIVYWNEAVKSAYVRSLQLPEPPPGKQYQLWADVDGEMINAGLLPKSGKNMYAVGYIDRAESLNITLEPEGGSDHPTVSNLVLSGKV